MSKTRTFIILSPKEFDYCQSHVDNKWSQSKTGSKWAEGLNSDGTFFGNCGEFAVSKYLNLEPNFDFVKGGEESDLVFRNKTIEIKTASKDFKKGLLKIKEQSGFKHELKSDIYIFCVVSKFDKIKKEIIIEIKGFISKEKILKKYSEEKPALHKEATHMNLEIPYEKITSIHEIFEKL